MSEYKYRVSLFYSYCHKDEAFKIRMEAALALLRDNNLLTDWSDRNIAAGSELEPSILKELDDADIVVYLVSLDFLNSGACKDEWNRAHERASESGQRLIPVIVRDCPWQDFDSMGEYLAIPQDGKPVTLWRNEDEAWNDVYEQIKVAICKTRMTFDIKEQFRRSISRVEFASLNQDDVRLDDIFVFPSLTLENKVSFGGPERIIEGFDELLNVSHAMIKGGDLSGKTTLCRKFFLHLAEQGQPALLINLNEVGAKTPPSQLYHEMYTKQMKGDFKVWEKSTNKTLILDNLNPKHITLLEHAQNYFQRIYVSTSDDIYMAYFSDEDRLANFRQIRLLELGYSAREELIRKWAGLNRSMRARQDQLTDGMIDQMEREVDSITLGRVIPRFPFFVLSILQTFEGYLPHDFRITAYGHCYYVLIIKQLVDLGISPKQFDHCLNFLSNLAYQMRISSREPNSINLEDFELFVKGFNKKYVEFKKSSYKRLFDKPNAVLSERHGHVHFSWIYSYYYFLGLHLSRSLHDESKELISNIVEKSYVRDNSLALIFLIHHSQNLEIIDDLLIHTKRAIDWRNPATFDLNEITAFENVLKELTVDYHTDNKQVPESREAERRQRDALEVDTYDEFDESPHEVVNDIYRALKNMDVLSQIVKNKYGSIEKKRLLEIIETIIDTGLRLASLFLFEESELEEFAKVVSKRLDKSKPVSKLDVESVKVELTRLILTLVIACVEKTVSSIRCKEVEQLITSLRDQRNTPAYDLIYNFYLIDVSDDLSGRHLDTIKETLRRHRKNYLITRALPIRTQLYLKTHRVSPSIQNALQAQMRR